MAKINNTSVYPNIIPTANDFVVLTDVNDEDKTKTAKVTDFQKFFGVVTAEITLTSAEILSSYSNPVEIIASPGTGKQIIPFGTVVMKSVFNNAAYAFAGQAILQQPGTPEMIWAKIAEADLEGVATETHVYLLNNLGLTNDITGTLNQGLNFKALTADPTTGEGTIKFSIQYRIVEL
tara:strand:- start:29869 stop:30402 length:534 start_codon:yes stop_codon:yes gene_type:complete